MTDEKKTDQPTKGDAGKVDELPPKQVSDRDAESVKGGLISSGKWDKK